MENNKNKTYLLNINNQLTQHYSQEEVQALINEKKIFSNTEIWTEQWGEWKKIQNTDFDSSNALEDSLNVDIKTPPQKVVTIIGAIILYTALIGLLCAFSAIYISETLSMIIGSLGVIFGKVFGKICRGYYEYGTWKMY